MSTRITSRLFHGGTPFGWYQYNNEAMTASWTPLLGCGVHHLVRIGYEKRRKARTTYIWYQRYLPQQEERTNTRFFYPGEKGTVHTRPGVWSAHDPRMRSHIEQSFTS